MPYSKVSQTELSTCHPKLQEIFTVVDELGFECTIVEGHRGKEAQDFYFQSGKSKVQWPDGEHNATPSNAVDAAPYINGKASWNKYHCIYFAGAVLAIAAMLSIKIRWGGNWDIDAEVVTDQDFQDLVHFEIRED